MEKDFVASLIVNSPYWTGNKDKTALCENLSENELQHILTSLEICEEIGIDTMAIYSPKKNAVGFEFLNN